MSGIFGVLDPRGVAATDIELAAREAKHRGEPVLLSGPFWVLGYFDSGQSPKNQSFETPDGLLIADCRIDESPFESQDSVAQVLTQVIKGDQGTSLEKIYGDFALAFLDKRARTVLLARDAFGIRPLFWARNRTRVGFASDPATLQAFGLGSTELNPAIVNAYLSVQPTTGEATVFKDINRVQGGHSICLGLEGTQLSDRWFRPEGIAEQKHDFAEWVEAFESALGKAVLSRSRGRKVLHLLSGGMDSGAVAAALGRSGIAAMCVTQTLEGLKLSEAEGAKELAQEFGLEWREEKVSSRPNRQNLQSIPAVTGLPIGFPSFMQGLSLRRVLSDDRPQVLFDGTGGEPLFGAPPVAVFDLMRKGHIRRATRAARGYRRWRYNYRNIAKAGLRSLAPYSLLELRERVRETPPWIIQRQFVLDPVTAPRSAREHLVLALLGMGESTAPEFMESLCSRIGVEYSPPLLDRRVVELALSLPTELRSPDKYAKPVLAASIGALANSRRKVQFTPFYQSLGAHLVRDFPEFFQPDSMAAGRGLVDGSELHHIQHPRWHVAALPLTTLEAWLRYGEGEGR